MLLVNFLKTFSKEPLIHKTPPIKAPKYNHNLARRWKRCHTQVPKNTFALYGYLLCRKTVWEMSAMCPDCSFLLL